MTGLGLNIAGAGSCSVPLGDPPRSGLGVDAVFCRGRGGSGRISVPLVRSGSLRAGISLPSGHTGGEAGCFSLTRVSQASNTISCMMGFSADDDEAIVRSLIGRMAAATLRRPLSCSNVAAATRPSFVLLERFPPAGSAALVGRRGSCTFSTSRECPPSVTPTPYPRPFQHLSMLPWWQWHCSSWDPVDFPLVRNLTPLVPSCLCLLWWQPSPQPSLIVYLRCPIICLQLDAFSISLNVPSSVVCRMRSPDLACSWARSGPELAAPRVVPVLVVTCSPALPIQAGTEDRSISAGEGSSHPGSAWARPHPRLL